MKPTQEEINCMIHNTTFSRLLCLNDVKARLYLPVTIFLAVLIVVGTIGNAAVCMVYLRRKTRVSSHYFILALAALDLMTCVIGLPTEIADLLLPYTFDSPWACKILRFTHSSTIIASSTILIQVAFDRYYRICQLGRQFTANKAKFLCVGAVILGFICSWPTFLLFGRKTVTRRISGNVLKGTDCTTDDSMRRTIYPTIYYVFLFSLFGITVIFFAILYSKIGLTILRRKKFTSGSVNSPPATPRGLKRTGSRKANAADPPSIDISSGHDEGHGNSTASSGSSASNGSSSSNGSSGSNFSTATSTTTVSAMLYGNLRRFCGHKKDLEGGRLWPPHIIGPVANSPSIGHRTTISSNDRSAAIQSGNTIHDNSNRNSMDNNIDNNVLNSNIDLVNRIVKDTHVSSSFNSRSNLTTSNIMPKTDSSSQMTTSNNIDNCNYGSNIIPSNGKNSANCNNIRITTTARTRVYVSENAKSRMVQPIIPSPLNLRKLQDHIIESEDEEKPEQTGNVTNCQQNQEQTSKRSQRQIRVGKTTTVLFAVTLAYILSFLPYLTVMVMRSIIKDLEENLSPVGELAYKLCVKSFFINNAINPLIYSFLNQAFRQDAKQMLSRMFSRSRSSRPVGRVLHHGDAV